MKKYIYKKEKGIKNEWYCLGVFNENEEIPKELEKEIIFISDDGIDDTYYYDTETNEVKKKSKYQLYKDGIYFLKAGEKEENGKIIEITQPTDFHKWNGTEWVVDIGELKLQKREELKRIRDKSIRDNISLYGVEFQVRDDIDIENFKDVERGIEKGYAKPDDKRFWILADNTMAEFTNEQLSKVLDEKAKRKEQIFNKYGILSHQLAQANTIDDIELIEWK